MKIPALILSLLIAALIAPVRPAAAASLTLTVQDGASIQAAIETARNDTANSYTISVEPGAYAGGLLIQGHQNSLTLKGRETARTEISGGGSPLLTITGNATGSIVIRNLFFRSATDGIQITNNTASVTIANNIFSVGTSNRGIVAQGSAPVEIKSNTFYRNSTAVTRDADTVIIRNNLFSGNTTAIDPSPFSDNGIFFNLFDPAPDAGDLKGSDYQPDGIVVTGSDPFFVNAGSRDFHVRTATTGTSPVIDRGDNGAVGNDNADGTPADIGAYGGTFSDTLPFRIANVTSTATSTFSVSVSWSENLDYRVAGYQVYYGLDSGTYTTALTVTGATSTIVTGLTATALPPAQPVMSKPEPRNESLILKWTEAPTATSYIIHYALASAPTLTIDRDVGNVTSYYLSGLVNYETYNLAVSAIAQPALYSAVTASYPSTCTAASKGPGIGCESAYSNEAIAYYGDPIEGQSSLVVTGIPEPITAYPDLPNTGCFIATAAFGSSDAAPVRILRAFRDRRLLTNTPGRAFVDWYYRTSPALSQQLNGHPVWKPLVRAALAPVVVAALVLTYAPWLLVPAAAFSLVTLRRRLRQRRTS